MADDNHLSPVTCYNVTMLKLDSNGNVVIHDYKSSATAPLTHNQEIAFEELQKSGGTVLGAGKGIVKGGYQIPAGTNVEIIRPE